MNRFGEGLRYLYGRKMVVATSDQILAQSLIRFLDRYGVQVVYLADEQAVLREIQQRLYGTRRVYLAILIDAVLARHILPHWRRALAVNPILGETPVAVLCDQVEARHWSQVPQVRHVLPNPPGPRQMLKWLAAISRWRSFVHELEKRGQPPACLLTKTR